MTQKFINNYSTTVAQTFGSGDTYLRVASPVGLPVLGVGEYFLLTVFRKVGQNESGHEVVKVTEVVSDQLTVQRSIEGVAASTFIVGDRVEARLTAGSLDSFTDAAQAAAAAPVQSVAGKTGAIVLVKADVGLANVDNTSDASKPVSTATQTALNAKLSDAPSDGKTYWRKNAAWVEAGGSGITNASYDNRGTLRTTVGTNAVVDGLGLFVFEVGSTEPDDDESCFATATGRWLLEAAHWDVVDAWQAPTQEYEAATFVDLQTRWPGRVIFGTATSNLTSVAGVTEVSFTGTVAGAVAGDRVLATPTDPLGQSISYFACVTSSNTVTMYLYNTSTSTRSIATGLWNLIVFKES